MAGMLVIPVFVIVDTGGETLTVFVGMEVVAVVVALAREATTVGETS